jgi:hypothetical protein
MHKEPVNFDYHWQYENTHARVACFLIELKRLASDIGTNVNFLEGYIFNFYFEEEYC